jgi:hypothetical protein
MTGMGSFYDRIAEIKAVFYRFNSGTEYYRNLGNKYATKNHSHDVVHLEKQGGI